MLAPNNVLFDSAAATDGAWFNIRNYSALSVHLTGLEAGSDTWIEVSNNPLDDPLYGNSPPTPDGVPITGNLAGPASYSPPTPYGEDDQEADISFSDDNSQCMWSPSCLIWNYIRVVKTGGGSVETKAYLFGQIST